MRIIADSSTLYSPAEGEKLGVTIIPASVIIKDESYKDFEDISSEGFLDYIEAGNIATSSQPAIGDVLQVFEESDEEILFLSIGDGLSGTYQNAAGARNCVENHEHIHVVDTRTLAGPQRYLVNKAIQYPGRRVIMKTRKTHGSCKWFARGALLHRSWEEGNEPL